MASGVFSPRGRHADIEVAPDLPESGDQRGEHPGHAILDLAGDARVLRSHACGEPAFPQVSGLIDRDPRGR